MDQSPVTAPDAAEPPAIPEVPPVVEVAQVPPLVELPGRMATSRMVATMPDRPVASLLAAVEVMVQEGISSFSFPAGQLAQVEKLVGVFGPRATFGVHDVDTAGQLDAVLDAGAGFVSLVPGRPELVAAALETPMAVMVTALTPTEVVAAHQEGLAAVVVAPAEAMGASYPQALAQLVGAVPLMARGGLGAYAARRWIEAGARAVWLDDALLGDVVTGGQLAGLRERCQTFRSAVSD